MATIGENFPLTRVARRDHLNQIKKLASYSSAKVPGKGMMKVYRIPLQYLSYNPYNTRFLAQAKTLERRFGCRLSDENPEHISAIEKFIWEEKKDANEGTIDSLKSNGQLQPGVVTSDGIILSGNRRFRLINEIARNPDKYLTPGNDFYALGLDFFEAVILDEEELDEKKIIYYESFYQFGIEDKVDYNPIQKYIAAHKQKTLDFSLKQIAKHFMSITKGSEKEVEKWLEVYELMDEYLKYIGEEGIYTALEGREEAFLSLRSTLRSFKTGRAANDIWAFENMDLDELKITFFDYIRLNIPTHDFRLFKKIFSTENQWKKFSDNVGCVIGHEKNQVDSFNDYRKNFPEADESEISKRRQIDYQSNVEEGLKRLYDKEDLRIKEEVAQELPLDILKTIQQKLSKLEKDMSLNGDSETYESEEFFEAIRDILKRIGRIKQKVD